MKIGNIEVYGVIYKITNTINGKCYIGQTTLGFNKRYNYNLYKNTKNMYLKYSIEKYGIENFEIIKIFDIAFSKEELNQKEICWINYYNSNNPDFGYNLTEGGEGTVGWCHTEETKRKMSKIKKGKNPLENLSDEVLKERNKKNK